MRRFRRIGDFYADRLRWPEAADWFKRAWEFDRLDSLSLYLRGYSLQKAGEQAEGQQLMHLAELLPLADPQRRYDLAQGLERRGLRSAALRERELLLRTAAFDTWHVEHTAGLLANTIAATDPLRAVDLWRRDMLPVLDTGIILSDQTALLTVPHMLHRAQARALLTDNNINAALNELKLAQTALPANVDLAAEFVPRLGRAGVPNDAERLFDDIFTANAQVCRDFPRAAEYHDRIARLCLGCNRRLDDGLRHAQSAVKLVPENATYLVTLAELCHKTGDFEQAHSQSRRAADLDPENPRVRAVIERLELE